MIISVHARTHAHMHAQRDKTKRPHADMHTHTHTCYCMCLYMSYTMFRLTDWKEIEAELQHWSENMSQKDKIKER